VLKREEGSRFPPTLGQQLGRKNWRQPGRRNSPRRRENGLLQRVKPYFRERKEGGIGTPRLKGRIFPQSERRRGLQHGAMVRKEGPITTGSSPGREKVPQQREEFYPERNIEREFFLSGGGEVF